MRFKPGDHIQSFADDAIFGLLSADEVAYVEQHAATCDACRESLEQARRRYASLAQTPQAKAPEALVEKTVTYVREHHTSQLQKRHRVGRIVLGLAAAIALTLGGFHLYFLNMNPSPYDLRVLGQREMFAGSTASLRTVVLRSANRQPMANIPVTVELIGMGKAPIQLASYKTDQLGSSSQANFTLPDWAPGQYTLRIKADTPGRARIIDQPITLRRQWRVMLSTDKPVYQPGQTILMRALSLRQPDQRPIAGESVEFRVTDPRGNVIHKQKSVTSSYGISSATCQLAAEVLHGTYTLAVNVAGTETSSSVEVKPYVLPKFKLTAQADHSFYQPGSTAILDISARYFFGKPVADAQVTIQLLSPGADETLLATRSVRADSSGNAKVRLQLPQTLSGRPQDHGDARLRAKVTIQDSAGQQESRIIPLLVTAHPLRIRALPESGELVRGVENCIYIVTTYADGSPAQTRLAITGYDKEIQTDKHGLASIRMTPHDQAISLTMRAADTLGLETTQTENLTIGSVLNDFLVRPEQTILTTGSEVKLRVLAGGVEPVFLDLLRDGQTIATTTIAVKNGSGEGVITLPDNVTGTLELVSYRYGTVGLPIRKSRTIYVADSGALAIRATLDRPEYRPGETAKLALTLVGKDGKPKPGAISLAAVDEAVFSVLSQTAGMEKTFFTLEQKALEPVYTIYPWSPNLDGTTTQAIFSATSRTGGDRDFLIEQMAAKGELRPHQIEWLRQNRMEDVIRWAAYDNETEQMLSNTGPHTLSRATYAEETPQIERARRENLSTVYGLWTLFGILCGIALLIYIASFFFKNPILIVLAIIALLSCLVSIMLPSLGRARELADRSAVAANLRQVVIDKLGVLYSDLKTDEKPRVREYFPETLLWRPELITDDQGRASLDVPLADSITTWRLSASAVTQQGTLGSTEIPIRVFQPFFVDINAPLSLMRNDEVSLPIVIYNYLDKPQTVTLTLNDPPAGLGISSALLAPVELAPGQVCSVQLRLRATQVGTHTLQITARAGEVTDIIRKSIEVAPNGQPVENSLSGTLEGVVTLPVEVPSAAVPGSQRTTLRIYPSTFSQLVQGLDAIFQMPYGCFEQTSSTTYPNVLALDYLRRTGKPVPAVEAKARDYIHLGYQRLVSFEVKGGGFDWFGRPPANRILTAYGLMEFCDMAAVHDVDPALITRTRDWLLSQRNGNGSWTFQSGIFHDDIAHRSSLQTTAYIAWAVFSRYEGPESAATRAWLLGTPAETIDDTYTLALMINALSAMKVNTDQIAPYIQKLISRQQITEDKKLGFWNQSGATIFYGNGTSGRIEATAMATLALLNTHSDPVVTRRALNWLATSIDSRGTWYSTQATVLALKALTAASGKPLGGTKDRQIEINLDGKSLPKMMIPADQDEVVKQMDLTPYLTAGSHQVNIRETAGGSVGYQLVSRHHLESEATSTDEPIKIHLNYDRKRIALGQTVRVTAEIRANTDVPMVVVDLPIPPGCALETADLDAAVQNGAIAKYQVMPKQAIVYLRELKAGAVLKIEYRLRPTMPLRVTVPEAEAYEYYNPSRRGHSTTTTLEVTGS